MYFQQMLAWLDSEINIRIQSYLLIVFGEPHESFFKILKTQKVVRMTIANLRNRYILNVNWLAIV